MLIENLKTGTYPLIIHAPGFTMSKLSGVPRMHEKINPLWQPILKEWRKDKMRKPGLPVPRDFTILTWKTSDEKTILEESLERLNAPCIFLGGGIKEWKNIYKIRLLSEIIDSIKTPYIIALDCYDVLVLQDPALAIERFKAMECDMLYNAEKLFYPKCGLNGNTGEPYITEEWKAFQEGIAQTEWKYLNSGSYVVKTEFYKKFIEQALTLDLESLASAGRLPAEKGEFHQRITESDQVMAHWLFRKYYPRIKLDYKSDIFLNIVAMQTFKGYIKIHKHGLLSRFFAQLAY